MSVLFYLWFIANSEWVTPTVWLRNTNERGPAAAAAGTKCLAELAKFYFHRPTITRSQNIAIIQTKNLSSPAAETAGNFLSMMHEMIAAEEIKRIRLGIISDSYKIDGLVNVDADAVMMTDYYVLIMDDIEKFIYDMQYIVRTASWNPGGRFLILFNNPDFRANQTNGFDIATIVFQSMNDEFNAINVIFCYASGILTYDVYKTNPYNNPNECESFKPILIDICDNGNIRKGLVTRDHIREATVPERLDKCTFNFCARIAEPYINDGCMTGLEVMIMQILKYVMKFKTHVFCTNMSRGEVEGDGKWSNLLGMIRGDMCHFVLGGFFPDNDVHDDFDVTVPYLDDTYTWYVAKAPLQKPWKGLIKIFQPNTWLLFIIILFVSSLAWFFFGYTMPELPPHKRIVMCAMNTWAVFLGISANNRPELMPLRIFFVLLALYALNVTTLYTSQLISVFTNPAYDTQIDTIDEILAKRLPIGGREEYADWFKNEYDAIISAQYSFADGFQPSTRNLQRVREGLHSMLMNRLYVLSQSMRDKIHGIRGNVFTNQIEMVAERGFPLLPKFNRIIGFMKDSGLMAKINKDFIYNMTILKNIINGTTMVEDQIVLTVQHLQGAWAVLIVGLSISTLAFLLELVSATNWFRQYVNGTRRLAVRILVFLKLYEKKEKPMRKVLANQLYGFQSKKILAKQMHVVQSHYNMFEYIE